MEELLRLADRDGSSLTRSFWFGKFLQLLPGEKLLVPPHKHLLESSSPSITTASCDVDSTTPDHHCDERSELKPTIDVCSPNCDDLRPQIAEALKSVKRCETSLSPNVYDVVVNSSHSVPPRLLSSISESSFLLSDATLNWDTVSLYLEGGECEDYSSGARVCAAIAEKVYKEMVKGGAEMLSILQKGENFEWSQSPPLFVECIEELQGENPLKVNIALLLGTAALERALGDVYLTVSKATQCPPLLRDLLATAELQDILGKPMMYMLSCLIGPPSGLNLRNILWHGFASPSEISQGFAYLFFVIVSSLGKLLKSLSPSLPIDHRPFITFPQEAVLANIFPELEDHDLIAIEHLFSQSFFILPSMLCTWNASLQAFKTGRHGHCVALLLPCLEHSLRRVFACVNDCPQRALTAESTILYTTFDEILSPVLPNGQDNRLKKELGVPKMEMLLDLLVHREGPRVRDRISHGEVDFYKLSKVVSSHLISMVTTFCLQYSIGVDKCSERVYQSCLDREMKYTSLFHPVSLLRIELDHLVSNIHDMRNIPMPDFWKDMASERTAGLDAFESVFQNFRSCYKLCLPLEDVTYQQVKELIAATWEKPIRTLYVSRNHLEMIGVMRRTVENACVSANQIHDTASLRFKLYQERQLRSRQRANYDHLLRSQRLYTNALMVLVVMLVTVVASNLSCEELEPVSYKSLQRTLRKLLQFVENFNTQSSSIKNRWEEADKLCVSLATIAEQLPGIDTT